MGRRLEALISGLGEDRHDSQTVSKSIKSTEQRCCSPAVLLAVDAGRIYCDYAIAIPRILIEFLMLTEGFSAQSRHILRILLSEGVTKVYQFPMEYSSAYSSSEEVLCIS
jgi:hypothetical protein